MRSFVLLFLVLSSGVSFGERRRTKSSPPPPLMVAAATEKQSIETESTVDRTSSHPLEVGLLIGAGLSSLSNFDKVSRVKDRGAMDFTGGLLVNFNLPAHFFD